MEPYQLTGHELLGKIKKNEVSCQQLVESLRGRIKAVDVKVRAYVRNQDKPPGEGTLLPCDENRPCIPISIKDNICTEGNNTECCSRILAGFKPSYDATVVKKLEEAGMSIFEAKLNMDEFAFGSSTENSCFGPTHNPWDLERVPGGSSGGSAAAVAADEAIWALGSDTGGSIRQPAAFCGVVGLKPTYGRVSRYGLIAFASSLDQIGPITKDVEDCALLMNIISGHDCMDSTSCDIPVPDYSKALINDVKGIKIGIPKEYFVEGLAPEVKTLVQEALRTLKGLGVKQKEVSLPHTEYAIPVYYIVATAEASSNLARFDGVQYGLRAYDASRSGRDTDCSDTIGCQRNTYNLIDMYKKTRGEGFGEEAKRRILLGTFALSHGYYDAYYVRALKVRTLIKQDFDTVFEECDCIVTPTSPTPAFKIGEKTQDPLRMYLSDIYTISVNLAGIPAISIPCGFTKRGLPVGLQILARPFNEEMLLRVAYTYEQHTEWHKMSPTV